VNSPETIELDVRAHLKNWYGEAVEGWRHLRTYSIPYALPAQPVDRMEPVVKSPRLGENLFRCGDYCDFASLEGALRSGLRAAAAIGA
jgi:predicted NAD/FAD-dependent oxidoreductase